MIPDPSNNDKNTILNKYEIVDGQQRLTTISILLCSIYNNLRKFEDGFKSDDLKYRDFLNLKSMIALNINGVHNFRILPQEQSGNFKTYGQLLNEIGFSNPHRYDRAGNRQIYLAYRHFNNRVESYVSDHANRNEEADSLFKLLNLIKDITIVDIIVDNFSEAFDIFGTLNNRGMPLTAVDLIKNAVLRHKQDSIDSEYSRWSKLIEDIRDEDGKVRDRFFRQYFNAFRKHFSEKYICVNFDQIATTTNTFKNFNKLLEIDAEFVLKHIYDSGEDYNNIIGAGKSGNDPLDESLFRLSKVEGAPSYILLLNLYKFKDDYSLRDEDINCVVDFLIKFFLRRNLTDSPPTRDLIRIFMKIITEISDKKGLDVISTIKMELLSRSSNLTDFRKAIEGPIYKENIGATRFILQSLSKNNMGREFEDPWKRNENGNLLWTIEHIFPQDENISQEWALMIADGDLTKAREYHEQYVHTLGNLTLSGNNSYLSTKNFKEKLNARDKSGNYIGYLNGLWLNNDLKDKEKWDVESIKNRGERLVEETMSTFKFDYE